MIAASEPMNPVLLARAGFVFAGSQGATRPSERSGNYLRGNVPDGCANIKEQARDTQSHGVRIMFLS